MSPTTTAPTNRAVKFRGQGEREMPPYPKPKSQAQNAAMHAAAEGRSTIGIPKKVGQEFAKGAHSKSLKGLPKRMPGPKHAARMRKRARSAAKRGLISESAMKKHMGEGY